MTDDAGNAPERCGACGQRSGAHTRQHVDLLLLIKLTPCGRTRALARRTP